MGGYDFSSKSLLPQTMTIDKLNQELTELRNQPSQPCDHTHPTQGGFPQQGSGLAQQLSFAGTGAGGEDRLVELATQVEDFKFQVSSLTEHLEEAAQRTNTAEVSTTSLVSFPDPAL